MSVNKYRPHVLVLPEDDANRQLANGFLLDQHLSTRKVQVLEEAGGWNDVVVRFLDDHVAGMKTWADRFMVLLMSAYANACVLSSFRPGRAPRFLTAALR